jgi:hypothetical protein
MKHGFLIYLLFAFCLATNGQETRNILTGYYTELTDTKPVDKEAWGKQPGKPQLSWGSTDVRYSKLNVPSVNKTQRFADFRLERRACKCTSYSVDDQ